MSLRLSLTVFVLFLGLTTRVAAQAVGPGDSLAVNSPSASRLAARYYGIEFTREQRDSLADREIELILLIDTAGRASLADVNYLSDPVIIDSLVRTTRTLPPFQREFLDGEPREYVYTLRFSYPKYRAAASNLFFLQGGEFYRVKLEDFEYLERSKQRLDILYAAQINQFVGSPAKHLAFGGGIKMDVAYTDRNSNAYGLFMSFYGNKLRKTYDVNSSREQNSGPPTLLVGVQYGRWMEQWLLQGELGFAQHNVSVPLNDSDRDWLRFQGASLGLVANRAFPLGPGTTGYTYGNPRVSAGHLNTHVALRYNLYDHASASGLMVEIGVGYRLTAFGVERYKLRE